MSIKKLLIKHEGLRLKPYLDTEGKLTIGVGRNLDDVGISKEEAMYLLGNDIQRAILSARDTFPWYRKLNDARKMVVTAHRLGRARAALDQIARATAQKIVTLFGAGFCVLNLKVFMETPHEIGLRVLKACLIDIGGAGQALRLERLEALYSNLQTSGFTARTLSGCRLMIKGDVIIIARESGRSGLPEVLVGPGTSLVWDRRFEVALTSMAGPTMTVRALGAEGRQILKGKDRKSVV